MRRTQEIVIGRRADRIRPPNQIAIAVLDAQPGELADDEAIGLAAGGLEGKQIGRPGTDFRNRLHGILVTGLHRGRSCRG